MEYFPKQEFLEGAEQARASKTSDEQDLESFAIWIFEVGGLPICPKNRFLTCRLGGFGCHLKPQLQEMGQGVKWMTIRWEWNWDSDWDVGCPPFFCFLCFWFVWILDAPTFFLMAFQEQQALYAQDFAESQDFELNSLPSPQLSCHVPLSTLHDWHTESCFCSGKIGPWQSMDILRVGTTVPYACEFFPIASAFLWAQVCRHAASWVIA